MYRRIYLCSIRQVKTNIFLKFLEERELKKIQNSPIEKRNERKATFGTFFGENNNKFKHLNLRAKNL